MASIGHKIGKMHFGLPRFLFKTYLRSSANIYLVLIILNITKALQSIEPATAGEFIWLYAEDFLLDQKKS
ncbi:MAG: hypothetical protein V7L29_35065 [Nostoc sp.]|uniref:hypothetical protein n=1 Tax=Nostoc sp. TaxID=1180 RepID=UPI002FF4F46D